MRLLSKTVCFGLGFFFLILGFIGIFVPLLPTAPFILMSTFFFSKSSQRFHNYLLKNSITGSLICDWKDRGAIPLYGKVMALLTIIISGCWVWVQFKYSIEGILILGLLTGLLLFIMTRPTADKS